MCFLYFIYIYIYILFIFLELGDVYGLESNGNTSLVHLGLLSHLEIMTSLLRRILQTVEQDGEHGAALMG